MSKDKEEIILKHYMTMNRYGEKGIVPEVVDPNSPTAMLLKRIEEKRLGADCNRAIDMRGKVAGRVEQHRHQGLTHYLDKKSKKIFEDTVAKHGGRFTTEAFESVTNADHTFKAQQKKERRAMLAKHRAAQIKKKQAAQKNAAGQTEAPADAQLADENAAEEAQAEPTSSDVVYRKPLDKNTFANFGNLCVRSEARMTYSTKVFVLRKGGEPLFAKTIDISTNGVQVNCEDSDEDFKVGQELIIHYDALEKEFNENVLKSKYRVAAIEVTDEKNLLKLARIKSSDDRAFVTFFDSFIEKNKRRYKTDCQDLYERINSRIFEHSYCLNLDNIPVLMNANADKNKAVAILSNGVNSDIIHELTTNLTAHSISVDFIADYVLKLEKPAQLGKRSWHATIYCFISVEEKELYVASTEQLEDERERNLFIQLGRENNKFRAYHCVFSELSERSLQKSHQILDTIPGHQDLNIGAERRFLEELTHTMHIYDITASVSSAKRPDDLKAGKNALINFGSYKESITHDQNLEVLSTEFRRGRSEDRYIYETEAVVTSKAGNYEGMLQDFSIKGMCIQLNAPSKLKPETDVEVDLPSFAKITKDKRLKKMDYQVVGLNDKKTKLYLQRKSDKNHGGSEFFKALIEKNKDKLTICNKEDVTAFKTKIAQILFVDNMVSIPFFVGRGEKVAFEYKTLGYSSCMDHIDDAFKVKEDGYDIPFLTDIDQFKRLLKDQSRQEELGKKFATDAYIIKKSNGDMICKLARDFENEEMLKEFVAKIADAEKSYCYHITISKANKINKFDFEEDMSNLRVRSLTKHKLLSEQMDNIHYVGEAFDITGAIPHIFE